MSVRSAVHLQIPFHDVDAGLIVWHGHFYKYLEIARTELMRSVDLDVQQVVDLGIHLVVGETRCRHLSPLRYGDQVRVEAWFGDTRPFLKVHYEIFNETTGKRSARGLTSLVATTMGDMQFTEIPDEMVRRIDGSPAPSVGAGS